MPTVTVNAKVLDTFVEFSVAPPAFGVSVDPNFPSRLLVPPGEYFITLALLNGVFEDPAATINTPVGSINVSPSADNSSMCELAVTNFLALGQGAQVFNFSLFTDQGHVLAKSRPSFDTDDPTIINEPPSG